MYSCESIGHRLSAPSNGFNGPAEPVPPLTHSARRCSLTPARAPATRSPLSLGTPSPHQSRQGRQKIAPPVHWGARRCDVLCPAAGSSSLRPRIGSRQLPEHPGAGPKRDGDKRPIQHKTRGTRLRKGEATAQSRTKRALPLGSKDGPGLRPVVLKNGRVFTVGRISTPWSLFDPQTSWRHAVFDAGTRAETATST